MSFHFTIMFKLIKKFIESFSGNKKFTRYKLNPKFTDSLIANVYFLVKKGKLEEDRETALSFFNLIEITERLLDRCSELEGIQRKIRLFEDKKTQKENLKELQSNFINKTEAFHQQIYATLSTFVNLLMKISPKHFKNSMPRWSIQKFLSYSVQFEPKLSNSVKLLLKSGEIRNKCIDHPQQQSGSFEWQTFTNINKTYGIYFIRDNTKNQIDISSEFKSPIKILTTFRAKEVYIVPHHNEVFTAICDFFYGLSGSFVEHFK